MLFRRFFLRQRTPKPPDEIRAIQEWLGTVSLLDRYAGSYCSINQLTHKEFRHLIAETTQVFSSPYPISLEQLRDLQKQCQGLKGTVELFEREINVIDELVSRIDGLYKNRVKKSIR
ncbi:MAG: hypothetical protein A3E83_07535 [Gammaproteobacteria bacterium RIFCSPHIGHO2_12_FULL_41_20]|nr:MAG: hypothetical protein A3E83_07535 [Gammaproteobacteria bacterium RIFCSPHIGHO2_12_FULL_41_20]